MSKSLGFFCRRCFEPIILETNVDPNTYLTHSSGDPLDYDVDIIVSCPRCGHMSLWNCYIDPNIVPYIAKLNSLGYKTLYCCEGHNHKNGSHEDAYIWFAYNEQRWVLKYIPIEEPWEFDPLIRKPKEDHYYTLEPFNIKIKDTSYKHFNIHVYKKSSLKSRLQALERWINRLPECRSKRFTKSLLNLPPNSSI